VAWFDHPGRHGLPNANGAFKQELQVQLISLKFAADRFCFQLIQLCSWS